MEQAYAALQGQQAGRRVWAAIAEWLEWPLPHGAPGELEVEGWRDRSAGREVSLG